MADISDQQGEMTVTNRDRSGVKSVVLGLLIFVATFGAGWALAPDLDTASESGDSNGTAILVGVQGPGPNGNVTALDESGAVRWSIGDIISYQNVQQLDNGSVLATFAAGGYEDCGPYEPPCKRTGVRIIDPEPAPHVVWQWSYALRTRKDSEVHDAEMLPSGNVLVADMEFESIFVLDPETGEREWTWNASEFYEAPEDPTQADWLHLNDADYIGDDRFLVSIRNENQLLVIERGEGVVEVINDDGDSEVLDKQHNPHWLGDGAVLVADSENHRVVELHRNETTGEWGSVWAVGKIGSLRLDWPRDADRLANGNTLITDSRNNRVVEVDRKGDVVVSYVVPSLPYEADRLPHGETSAGSPHNITREAERGILDRKIPVLSTLLDGARHVFALPFWVSEVHLVGMGVAVGLWIRGGYLLVWRRLREKG